MFNTANSITVTGVAFQTRITFKPFLLSKCSFAKIERRIMTDDVRRAINEWLYCPNYRE